MIEEVELTPCHVGLGGLDEVSLMALFATVQAHRWVAGTGRRPDQIHDDEGRPLYPSFYWTHLVVPRPGAIERHRTWDRVAIAVDVRRHGTMILDSHSVLGRPDQWLAAPPAAGDDRASGDEPRMRGGNLLILADSKAEPQICPPAAGTLAELPMVGLPPAVARFRRIRAAGLLPVDRRAAAVSVDGRAPAPHGVAGAALMFAEVVSLLRELERRALVERLSPAIPAERVRQLALAERETFYLSSCPEGAPVRADLLVDLGPAQVAITAELRRQDTDQRIAAATSRHVIVDRPATPPGVPTAASGPG